MPALGNQSQGTLDGLCGIYAIVNALVVGCGRGDQKTIFKNACQAISKSGWPDILWTGTTFGDIQRMVKRCLSLPELEGIKASYPFMRDEPQSNSEYWSRFDEIFADDSARCAIMGITDPSMHWIVAGWDGKHVQFLNSTSGDEFLKKSRTMLYAGERKRKPSQWRLDRRELVIFSVAR